MTQKEIEFRQMQAEFEKKKLERDIEIERNKQMLKDKQLTDKKREKDKKLLEQKLAKFVPLITETNLIARELKREVSFVPYLAYHFSEAHDVGEEVEDENAKMLIMKVKVDNLEAGYFYFWDIDKFTSRYYMIKEMLDDYFETSVFPHLSNEEDPFWDPPEPQLIGQGFLKLLSIAYLLDNPTKLIMVGDNGQTGVLSVSLAHPGEPHSGQRSRRGHRLRVPARRGADRRPARPARQATGLHRRDKVAADSPAKQRSRSRTSTTPTSSATTRSPTKSRKTTSEQSRRLQAPAD